MAQLVEHNLAKVGVAGSSPVVRSIACLRADSFFRPFAYRRSGQVVRQRPAKPLPPVRIRASPPELFRASIWALFLVCTRAVDGTLARPELAAPPLSPCCKNALPLVPALELSAGMASRAEGPLRSGMIRYMYYFGPLFGSKVVPGNTQNEIGIIDNHFF